MSNLEAAAHLSKAREFASAAAYDVQQFASDTPERQAVHNLVAAVDGLIATLDAVVNMD
jgi:hypothetical protein